MERISVEVEIPQNWGESWDTLRAALQHLQECELDPQSAVSALLDIDSPHASRDSDASTVDDSSVAHLELHLGTTYVPRPASAKISKIDRHRLRLQSSSDKLAKMHKLFDPYLALLSPIRTMPVEILQEIFMACLPTRHDSIMHASHMPLILGRVCSRWRTISLSTPVLWSSVHVIVPSTAGDQGHKEVRLACESLQLWLRRSADCLLSITIFVPVALAGTNIDYAHSVPPLVDIIMPYSRRWKSFRLFPSIRGDLSQLWKLTSEDVPRLEMLEIGHNTGWDVPDARALQFLSVPLSLRDLTLNYTSAVVAFPSFCWQQLTSLCLASQRDFFTLTASQLVELVGQWVNLTLCRLILPYSSMQSPPFAVVSALTPHMILPRLHTLSIKGDISPTAPFNVATILDTFTLPMLQKLELVTYTYLMYDHIDASVSDPFLTVNELISRSSCDLQDLVIEFLSGDVGVLLRILQHCHGLTTLELRNEPTSTESPEDLTLIFNALAASGTSASTPLCPDLIYLGLVYCDHDEAVHPLLRTLIQSRCGLAPSGLARLKTVNLALSCPTSLDTVEINAEVHPSEVSITPPKYVPVIIKYSAPIPVRVGPIEQFGRSQKSGEGISK
ncbi:hypothetical protein B0H13DRAFT_2472413 [Mycena leptocephala]|nr:hypothetical protein B0H13DRAFT_2472413 [Mycena leptocephala]